MGKYGTNLEGFGGFEGGVNSEDGAPLVSTSSDGETALLFGPAALREIQAGVANGDFAIPPDESTATITSENPLPYWTFTDVNSAGAITCAVVADATAGSGNILRWSIANNTGTGKSAQISRYIPIATSRDRALTIIPDAYVSEALGTNARFRLTYSYVKQDFTTTGTGATGTRSLVGSLTIILANTNTVPSDAAYVYLVLTAETTGTTAALTGDIAEVKLRSFFSKFYITDGTDSAIYGAAELSQTNGDLQIAARFGAGRIVLDSTDVQVVGKIQADSISASAEQITIPDTTAGAGLTIGGDTNLYRSAANTLKTDDSLTVAGNLSATGLMTAGNIASGLVNVTPVANATTGVAVTGLSVLSSNATAGLNDFSVVVSANSAANALRTTTYSTLTFSGATLTGLTARVFRTDTTLTGVSWIVIGR